MLTKWPTIGENGPQFLYILDDYFAHSFLHFFPVGFGFNVYTSHILSPTVIIICFDLVELFFILWSERVIQGEYRTQQKIDCFISHIHESNLCCYISRAYQEECIRLSVIFLFFQHELITQIIAYANCFHNCLVYHECFDYTESFIMLYIWIYKIRVLLPYH